MSEVLLLWLATSPSGTEIVEASGSGIRLVHCTLREVALHALAPNALIAVVDDDHLATEALGAVVDDVVRQGDLTDAVLARAAVRARARARTRLRALDPRQRVDESDAMATLLEWVAIELVACVSGGVLEGELLEENVRKLVAREDVDASDTLEMLDTVRESFRRMQEVLQAVRLLSSSDGSAPVPLAPMCQALARVLQSRMVPVADVTLEASSVCATSIRPAKVVAALVLLANDILDRAAGRTAPGSKRVRVTLRTRAVEGAAIVEVEDDLDVFERDPQTSGSPIARVRSFLRVDGADVQLTSVPGRTTVRLLLPPAGLATAISAEELVRRARTSRPN